MFVCVSSIPELPFSSLGFGFSGWLRGAAASEAIWRFEFCVCGFSGSAGIFLAFGDNSDRNIAGVSEIDSLDAVTNENRHCPSRKQRMD